MGYWKERSLGNPRKETAIAYTDKHRYCWFFARQEPGELREDRGYGAYFQFYDSAAFIPKWRKEVKEGRIAPISEAEYQSYWEKRKKKPLLPPPITKAVVIKNSGNEENDSPCSPSSEIKSKLAAKLAEIKGKIAQKRQPIQQEPTPKPAASNDSPEYIAKIKQIVLGLNLGASDRPSSSHRGRKRKAPILATATIPEDFPKVDREELATTIDFLYSCGLPVLPVAPAFPAADYPQRKYGKVIRDEHGNPIPRFNGKCPSYLDRTGRPHAISHKRFQYGKLPSIKEISKWFAHPCTGVGTLGNINISFIDWDAKNFDSLEASDKAAAGILEKYGTDGLIEKTRSGGYRLAFRSTEKLPGKFSLAGKFCGEILGLNKFVVLAPTQGYKNLLRTGEIPILNLSNLGLDDRSSLSKQEREERRSISRETDPMERFPALFWQKYKHSVKPWMLARYKDPAGNGYGKFTLEDAAEFFNRRPSTIKNWLLKAKKNGLCRNLDFRNGYYYFYYLSVHKAAVNIGLENLGPCGLIDFENLEERQNLAIAATEIIQSDRQRSSRWAAQQESLEEKLPAPAQFFQSCEKTMACELWRNEKAIGFAEGGKLYGCSLSNVATAANLSRRQVQRHLNRQYREESAPVKKYRGEGLPTLNKAQLHQRLPFGCKSSFMGVAQEVGDAEKYWVDSEGRVWMRKCLIVAPRHQRFRWRFRKARTEEKRDQKNKNLR